MTRARQSVVVTLAFLAMAVCAVATTGRPAAAGANEPAMAAASAVPVAVSTFSVGTGGAPFAGTELGFCGGKRPNSPARSLCKKLKRGVSPESGQSPIVFVESVRLPLTTLQIAETVPEVTYLPDGTPPDLSLRAPPAL
jgi:hypothetical protein